jgi:hypothetical protein
MQGLFAPPEDDFEYAEVEGPTMLAMWSLSKFGKALVASGYNIRSVRGLLGEYGVIEEDPFLTKKALLVILKEDYQLRLIDVRLRNAVSFRYSILYRIDRIQTDIKQG